jgi:PIN domain nuclease of toxin-antitoxin system
VKILLDTHILIWWISDHPKLPKTAHEFLSDPDNSIYFSSMSIWEAAIKYRRRNLEFSASELRRGAIGSGFEMLPFHDTHALYVSALPRIHADPFDRALVAQAFSEPMHLLTHDAILAEYGTLVKLV